MIVKSKEKDIHYKQSQLVYIYIYLDGGGYLDTKSKNDSKENVHNRARNKKRMRNIDRRYPKKGGKIGICQESQQGKVVWFENTEEWPRE